MTQAGFIRTAIIELMEGDLGSARKLTADVFKFGAFEGQPVGAQQAHTIESTYTHRFDVQLGASRPHKSTPQSTKASYRIEARPVTIRVFTHLSSSADEDARLDIRETIEQNCSDAIGVLAYPGNLTQTVAGDLTGLASGMLCGAEDGSGVPRLEQVSEDWKKQLHVCRIVGTAIVSVAQPVTP
jgi:hypothetical protein